MWRRTINNLWPIWLIDPIVKINRLLPFSEDHEICRNTQSDRDVHNLFEKNLPHVQFTLEEESFEQLNLRNMEVPVDSEFVCLVVRDSDYLNTQYPDGSWEYHNFRDCNIKNYKLAVVELIMKGYYVMRMGAVVKEPLMVADPKFIDYATNGMRTDFMDIYLGVKCKFCITNGTGFDALPIIFRRPIVKVNAVPMRYMFTWVKNSVLLAKHHVDVKSGKELTFLLSKYYFQKLASHYIQMITQAQTFNL
jgi:putative glycosyltransferase (TIGR04372 family)